jgi:hypothetical protein
MDRHRRIHKQQGDFIRIISCFQNKESRLKLGQKKKRVSGCRWLKIRYSGRGYSTDDTDSKKKARNANYTAVTGRSKVK